MCINTDATSIARSHFEAAFRIVALRAPDDTIRQAMDAALDNPCPATLNHALAISYGKEWEPGLLFALAQVGVAASPGLLGGDHG